MASLTLLSCDPPPLVASAAPCPPGMVLVEGAGQLGLDAATVRILPPGPGGPADAAACGDAALCWLQTDLVDPILKPRSVQLAPFCVDAWPFPGAGARYTRDGMTAWDAQALDALLRGGGLGGRRLCTATELQAAAAGLRANLPLIYGQRADLARCDGHEARAGRVEAPIGVDPGCVNPETGAGEYFTRHAHWVVADAAFVEAACESPPCRAAGNRPLRPGMFIVLGGTGRLATRQLPLSPHTWHDHGAPAPAGCDDMGHDDQPALCADPDRAWRAPTPALAAEVARWQVLVDEARSSGSMTRALERGLGRAVCPAAPGATGEAPAVSGPGDGRGAPVPRGAPTPGRPPPPAGGPPPPTGGSPPPDGSPPPPSFSAPGAPAGGG
ncbi:MAG: hypothetical protein JNM72_19360 [Deltaproteobacteria bacterium]|nr:hypothetical protein [Deltaproteobacteria bacterium]